jgi:Sec7-like guanine-nucleotide exchange factor
MLVVESESDFLLLSPPSFFYLQCPTFIIIQCRILLVLHNLLHNTAVLTLSANGKKSYAKNRPADEVAEESRSSQVTVAADMVFSTSKNLSGSAIVDFVQALSEVSWDEIQSSGSSPRPRMFSLQKLVEISYYNMGRIRLEWSNIWLILGEHFNQASPSPSPLNARTSADNRCAATTTRM